MLALQYIAQQNNRPVSAKEIAERYGLSHEFLSKTLQQLTAHQIIESQQGIYGGYRLRISPENLSLGDIILVTEGSSAIVECEERNCSISDRCSIREPMHYVQMRVNELFQTIKLSDFLPKKETETVQ